MESFPPVRAVGHRLRRHAGDYDLRLEAKRPDKICSGTTVQVYSGCKHLWENELPRMSGLRIGEEELDWKDKLGAQRRDENSPAEAFPFDWLRGQVASGSLTHPDCYS
ncbi:Inactive Ubiquitin Thioesterase Otulinl [Manis pentadactyla]|nr:Inactive Ubiquitin Thioesterase Otulinl [Manis pentadactyla]